jgi:diaminopimelate decarboxylase
VERGSRQDVPESAHFRREAGELTCDGVPLRALAEAHGTPLHVVSEAAVRAAYEAVTAALRQGAPERPHLVCYAMKASGSPGLLRRLVALGAGCDVVSGGELYWALRAGFPAEKVVMSGVGKTDAELEAAIRAGVSIHVESEAEIEALRPIAERLERPARIGLRINPNVDAATHPYIATGLFDTKFGLSMELGERLGRELAKGPLVLESISSHIGSQIGDLGALEAAAEITAALAVACRAEGAPVTRIDVGGGWPVAYGDEDHAFPAYREIGAAIGRGLSAAKAPRDLALVVEPGRALVGQAGVLVTRVLFEKRQASPDGRSRRFVVVDGAMTELIRPSLYGAYHAVETVAAPRGEASRCDLVGPVCESGDFFARDRLLPPLSRGELVVLRTTGAYGAVMASEYNARPRAAEVMVAEGGVEVLRPRGRIEDLHPGG